MIARRLHTLEQTSKELANKVECRDTAVKTDALEKRVANVELSASEEAIRERVQSIGGKDSTTLTELASRIGALETLRTSEHTGQGIQDLQRRLTDIENHEREAGQSTVEHMQSFFKQLTPVLERKKEGETRQEWHSRLLERLSQLENQLNDQSSSGLGDRVQKAEACAARQASEFETLTTTVNDMRSRLSSTQERLGADNKQLTSLRTAQGALCGRVDDAERHVRDIPNELERLGEEARTGDQAILDQVQASDDNRRLRQELIESEIASLKTEVRDSRREAQSAATLATKFTRMARLMCEDDDPIVQRPVSGSTEIRRQPDSMHTDRRGTPVLPESLGLNGGEQPVPDAKRVSEREQNVQRKQHDQQLAHGDPCHKADQTSANASQRPAKRRRLSEHDDGRPSGSAQSRPSLRPGPQTAGRESEEEDAVESSPRRQFARGNRGTNPGLANSGYATGAEYKRRMRKGVSRKTWYYSSEK